MSLGRIHQAPRGSELADARGEIALLKEQLRSERAKRGNMTRQIHNLQNQLRRIAHELAEAVVEIARAGRHST